MTCDVQSKQALLRADLWRILALALGPPSRECLSVIRDLCGDLVSTLDARAHPLRSGLAALAQCVADLDTVSLAYEYHALFSTDVLVPAYEGSYQRIERGAVVGDVAGYYNAFGLAPTSQSGPPDSLFNELAFLSWLSLKESFAIEHGLDEPLAVTRDAMRDFLAEHLGRWAGAFAARLLHTTENPFFVTAAHLLLATVSLAADDAGVKEIEPLDGHLAPERPEAITCPLGNMGGPGFDLPCHG